MDVATASVASSAGLLAQAQLREGVYSPPDGACFFWSMCRLLRIGGLDWSSAFATVQWPLRDRSPVAQQMCVHLQRLRSDVVEYLLDPAQRWIFEEEPK